MTIVLTRYDNALGINPAPPYVLHYLRYSHRGFKMENWRRVNDFKEKLLHIPAADGGVLTLQGFFKKVCRLIERNLDVYQVQDVRTPLPPIDYDRVKRIGLRDYQIDPTVEALDQIKQNCGVFLATGGFGKTYLMASTYAAWNSLNTIVATPLKTIFTQTHKKFVSLFPEKHIGACGDGANEISSDITIATFASLKKCALEKCQLLLVDEIQQTTGEYMQEILTQMRPIRVLGYTATDKNLFNGADKLLKGLFGERLIDIPYPEAETAGAVVPGEVYMIRTPESLRGGYSSPDKAITYGIKRNEDRNKLVGEVCIAVPNKWQTIIFVEHVADHLIPLMKFMPQGTKYIHRTTDKNSIGAFALTPKQQQKVVDGFGNNDFQYLVATDCLRAGADIPNIRVVVQASSGSSEVEILQEAFRGSRTLTEEYQKRLGVGPKTHFVLIDFQDNHDTMLANMANTRAKLYEKQGWKVHRVDSPTEIKWEQYSQAKEL